MATTTPLVKNNDDNNNKEANNENKRNKDERDNEEKDSTDEDTYASEAADSIPEKLKQALLSGSKVIGATATASQGFVSNRIRGLLSRVSSPDLSSGGPRQWQGHLNDLSDRLFKSTLASSHTELHVPRPSVDAGVKFSEDAVPKLPVPELEHTIERYLEAMQPVLSEAKFGEMRKAADEFSASLGPQLQSDLLRRRQELDNWAYDWWLHDMYLNVKLSLPINSNPGMVFEPRPLPPSEVFGIHEMARFGAKMIFNAAQYKRMLNRKELPIERIPAPGMERGQAMCMAQFYRVFTSYRTPGVVSDKLLVTETTESMKRPHVIVACRDQFYMVPLTKGDTGDYFTENELMSKLLYILNENLKRTHSVPQVGILTTLPRDIWGSVHQDLANNRQNRQSLRAIETSLMIVCFDMGNIDPRFNRKVNKQDGHRVGTRDDTSMVNQMIHGCGSTSNSANRWFDKTIQLVIGSDGVNGLCYEHSPAEGVAVIQIMESLLKKAKNLRLREGETCKIATEENAPQKITWILNEDLEEKIEHAAIAMDRSVRDLDIAVHRFHGFGKEFIKSCGMSPDAFVQMALQLTYYKIHNRLTATYESASTRRFLLGRVDCIRATHMEGLTWVKAMKPDTTRSAIKIPLVRTDSCFTRETANKLELLRNAMKKQALIMTENIMGHGIDIHLLGLREAAKLRGLYPDIFNIDSYSDANHFALSTSQISTVDDTFMGYGAVVPDGYGASYNLKPDMIVFCLSTFRSCETTDTEKFASTLDESLMSMKEILDVAKKQIKV